MPLPLVACLVAFATTYLLTPLVRRLAVRVGAVTRPAARSVHTTPTPHLGGLAIYASFAVTLLLIGELPRSETVRILACGLLALGLGTLDDFRDLSPRTKLLGQVLVASLLVGLGVRIHFITNPFGDLIYLGSWSYPLSVLWVVAVMNVVNLADGLDGLAAGICAIAAIAALFASARVGLLPEVTILAAALAGSTVGFLPHNFNPAKIFMGDAGAMFLGFTLAAISIHGALKQTTAVALLVPIVALGLPITDTALAIYRRLRAGRSVGQADRGHLHHRLLDLGLTQRQAVLVMWGVTAWLGLSAVLLSEVSGGLGFVLVMSLGLIGLLAFVSAVGAGSLPREQGKNLPE
ncbi:MAG TPA: undecaprenyl-phosphate alpha-N-acetylglucosaminyl 1-phosphate transferase [Clostridiales bacterium]|nr:undecaprenyl-phosphate alpha-N-acetylglucosaminyl 1-phosphate transferase [Clostridiales bacterium]